MHIRLSSRFVYATDTVVKIHKYTQFCVCAVRVLVYMALIRYANKYRYFYAKIALLSRVHVETCRIRFFNLLN